VDSYLADLILEHDTEIFPYIKLRALYAKAKTDIFKVEHAQISAEVINSLQISGLVKQTEKHDSFSMVTVLEQGKLMGYPKSKEPKKVKVRKEYIPQGLSALAEISGYPDDWEKNTGKYRSLYFSMVKKYPQPIMESVAQWTKKRHPEYKLNVILTDSWFHSLKSKMEAPQTTEKGRETSSGYDDIESLLAAEKQFMGE